MTEAQRRRLNVVFWFSVAVVFAAVILGAGLVEKLPMGAVALAVVAILFTLLASRAAYRRDEDSQ